MANRAQVTPGRKHPGGDLNSACRLLQTSDCAGFPNENEKWTDNEAHGGLFGVYMNKDGLPGCSQIRGFFIWKSFDHAIYFQVSHTSRLSFFFFLSFHPQNKCITWPPKPCQNPERCRILYRGQTLDQGSQSSRPPA